MHIHCTASIAVLAIKLDCISVYRFHPEVTSIENNNMVEEQCYENIKLATRVKHALLYNIMFNIRNVLLHV